MRVLWWMGGVLLGVMVGGLVSAIAVPVATRAGMPLGSWFMWVVLVLCVAGGVWIADRASGAGPSG